MLVQAFYSVRSERQLMEQLDYNLMSRWFVGLSMDAPIWDVTVFTKDRDRLLEGDVAAKFMAAVLGQSRVKALLSQDQFSVDGTLIEAWASMESFKPKDGAQDDGPDGDPGEEASPASAPASGGTSKSKGRNSERDFHGEKRSNDTDASSTDPDARLFKKARGQAARLCHIPVLSFAERGHLLMENRHGSIVDTMLTHATALPSARPCWPCWSA